MKVTYNNPRITKNVNSKCMVADGVITDYTICRNGTVYDPSGNIARLSRIKGREYLYYISYGQKLCRRLDYLVAENFIDTPARRVRLIHIDGNNMNSNANNLQWMTIDDVIKLYTDVYMIDKKIFTTETWRFIETPMGNLEVSSFGKVRDPYTEKIIEPKISMGYKVLYYVEKDTDAKRTKVLFVHKLVARAFIPNPNEYTVVNHMDGNRLNCAVCNLEWCNVSMNTEHGFLHNSIAPINQSRVHQICELLSKNVPQVEISRITGVGKQVISDIYCGRRHTDVSKNYVFPKRRWDDPTLPKKIVDLINQGYKGQGVLCQLNIPIDKASISFYERVRRENKALINK